MSRQYSLFRSLMHTIPRHVWGLRSDANDSPRKARTREHNTTGMKMIEKRVESTGGSRGPIWGEGGNFWRADLTYPHFQLSLRF